MPNPLLPLLTGEWSLLTVLFLPWLKQAPRDPLPTPSHCPRSVGQTPHYKAHPTGEGREGLGGARLDCRARCWLRPTSSVSATFSKDLEAEGTLEPRKVLCREV